MSSNLNRNALFTSTSQNHQVSRSGQIERALDRYVGIPLVFLGALVRRNRSLPESPTKIGIIQPTAIGDMILISGLIDHLRKCFPKAEIHIFHGASNQDAVLFLPANVISHCCKFKKPLRTLVTLRDANLDVLINCAPWTRLTALLSGLSGASVVGFRSEGQFIHPLFDVKVPYLYSRHETENHRAIAEIFGPLPDYSLTLRKIEQQPDIVIPYDRIVLFHIAAGGSRAKQKSWPYKNWAILANNLIAKGWIIGFTGVDKDIDSIKSVIDFGNLKKNGYIILAGKLNLIEMAYVLNRAQLLVTIDTGIAHLAAALGSNMVGLYGPTRFERWGAFNSDSAIGLNAPHPAAGHLHFGFERHPQEDEIMASLSSDIVLKVVDDKLQMMRIKKFSCNQPLNFK